MKIILKVDKETIGEFASHAGAMGGLETYMKLESPYGTLEDNRLAFVKEAKVGNYNTDQFILVAKLDRKFQTILHKVVLEYHP